MLTSALQLFGNFLSSEIGQLHTERNMMAQHQMNKEIMDYQHNQNIQNMLNSGIYERRSRENAGLNVNNGAPFTPVGTSAVGSSAPSGALMAPVNFADFVNATSNAQVAEKQAKKLDAEANAIEQTLPYNLDKLRSETAANLSESDLADSKRIYQDIVNDFAEGRQQAEIDNLWSDTADKNMRALLSEAGVQKVAKEIEQYNALIDNITADTALKGAQKVQALALAYKARMEGMFTKEQAERYDEIITSTLKKNASWMALTDEQKAEVKARILLLGKDLQYYDERAVAELVNKYADTTLKGANAVESGSQTAVNIRKAFLGF